MIQDKPQKIKLLTIMDYLQRETDEGHPVSRQNLCRKLNELGIPSNPRTLSLDIAVLNEAGYEIMENQVGREKFYYVEDRKFSVAELKIMIDAIEAVSFISEKRTDEIVDKIASLGGMHQAELLKQNMVCFNTRKKKDSRTLFSISNIEDAISAQKMISFSYFDLDEKHERVLRKSEDGEERVYLVEPVALVFNEDNYYLVAYSKKHPERTANYRVDRMSDVEIVEDSKLSSEAIRMIDQVAKYMGQAFKMYSGDPERVVLEFDRNLTGPVYDKFGEEIKVIPSAGDRLLTTVDVQVSPTFFGWLAQFSDKMRIISPPTVRERYQEHIRKILEE